MNLISIIIYTHIYMVVYLSMILEIKAVGSPAASFHALEPHKRNVTELMNRWFLSSHWDADGAGVGPFPGRLRLGTFTLW